MPTVTAKSWVLYEMRSGKQISGKRNYKKREMASLTKMMNLITVLEIMQREGLDPAKIRVTATKAACSVTGTTAELKMGAIYTLYDLLFGMMLPSGNDAAYLIAETCGWLLKLSKEGKLEPTIAYHEPTLRGLMESNGQTAFYMREMNRLALKLQMVSSNFANPHGLSCTSNYSTAEDLAKLCMYSMRNPLFRSIVYTQIHPYTCQLTEPIVEDKENADPNAREWKGTWENTNKMLKEGWSGIKTGITPNAGPCLAASVTRCIGGQTYEFLVILLNS
jgi:D-alanyl-D-alanine carboxypeptidase